MEPSHAQVIPAEGDHSKMTLKQHNGVSHDPAYACDKLVNQCCERPTLSDTSSDVACSNVLTSLNPAADVTSASSTEMVPPQSSQSGKVSKVGYVLGRIIFLILFLFLGFYLLIF